MSGEGDERSLVGREELQEVFKWENKFIGMIYRSYTYESVRSLTLPLTFR